jgi:drug/metabolite transporter (DMT)-like permease
VNTRSHSGLAAALAAVVIWGLVPVGTRYFVLQVDPLTFNVIRYLFSGVGALPLFCVGAPWRWPARDRWRLVLCAVLAVPGYSVPVAFAARSLSAGRLGLLVATGPIFIIVFSAWLQRRRIQPRIVIGGLLALVGVGLTSLSARASQIGDWSATLLVLVGAMSWAGYTVLVADLTRRHGAFPVTGGVLVVGSILLIGVSLPMIANPQIPPTLSFVAIGALGLASSLLGFLLWNYAASAISAERIGLLLYLLPLIALVAGASILNERYTWTLFVGGALTLVGVAVGERR